MGNFIGGSAYGMAQQICNGFILVTERTFIRMARNELDGLAFELDKVMREVRGEQPPQEDLLAIKDKNRRMQRLNSATTILQSFRQRRKI